MHFSVNKQIMVRFHVAKEKQWPLYYIILHMYRKHLMFKFTNGVNHINKLVLRVLIILAVVNIHKFKTYV